MRFLYSTLLVVGLALLAGCPGNTPTQALCETNLDCPLPGTRCNMETQQCVCATDEACADGEFCNRAGVCQLRTGCGSNLDCASIDGAYCDIDSGKCLNGPALMLSSECGLHSHCPYRTLCTEGQCVAGCHDDGDCVLGEVCVEGQCASGSGLCSDDDFCGYRQRCENGQCKTDRRGPYCRGCTFRTALNPEPCDEARNFCLINSAETMGHRQFCGVDCSLGQECPNGYDCNFVVILTEDVCTFDAQCQCDPQMLTFATSTCAVARPCDPRLPNGMPDSDATACTETGHPQCNTGGGEDAACLIPVGESSGNCTCATDDDCADGTCVAGLCCSGTVRPERECRVGEARVSGFCSCATDDDCPRDSCDPSRGACAITGRPCTPGSGDCGPVPCVNGGCQIGQNCAPIQGLSCSVVGG